MAARSPITYLAPRPPVPLDLAAGRFDSTVAVVHTLRAFQRIAPYALHDEEIVALTSAGPGLVTPAVTDTAADPLVGRQLFLRRTVGGSRVTVFDGGHEWIPRAAIAWLAPQRKP